MNKLSAGPIQVNISSNNKSKNVKDQNLTFKTKKIQFTTLEDIQTGQTTNCSILYRWTKEFFYLFIWTYRQREPSKFKKKLFFQLKVDDQSTIEGRQQQFESLKKIEEQQKQKAQNQRKKIGDKLKKQIEDHIKKTEKEAAEKKEIKKEEENQKDSKKDEENKKNVEKKKIGGKQQNSFEIQSSSKTPNDGDLASIRCPDGIYQGVVKEVNAEDQTIRLENPLL